MRLGIVLVLFAVAFVPSGMAWSHPADEFPQVTLQVRIDDDAVELIVRIPAKAAMMDVLGGLTPVAMDQMEPEDLATLIAPVLASRCPVTIDGVLVPPRVIQPVVDMANSRQPARRFPLPQVLEQGTLMFVSRYETKGPPRTVSLDWSIYANQYDEAGEPIHEESLLMVAALLVAEGKEQFVYLTPMEPGYTWHASGAKALPADLLATQSVQRNFLSVPVPSVVLVVLGLVCGGITLRRSMPRAVGLVVFSLVVAWACLPFGRLAFEHTPSYADLDDAEALAVFESLHRNIYRAFDYTDEGAVYDALAQSVDGPMLETIYNDVYQSLIMREENGAVSKVVRVSVDRAVLDREVDDETAAAHGLGAYVVVCNWQVDGVVTHYGHTHARTNAFEAVYTVAPRADGWRIVESQVIDQARIDDGYKRAQDIFDDP